MTRRLRAIGTQRTIALLLVFATSLAQAQTGTLSAHAAKIKARVAQIAPSEKLTVIMLRGPSYHGALRSSEDESFSLDEVDKGTLVSLRYDDVKKVQNGYGGYNAITGTHVNPVRARVVGLLILTGLVVIVVVALSVDK